MHQCPYATHSLIINGLLPTKNVSRNWKLSFKTITGNGALTISRRQFNTIKNLMKMLSVVRRKYSFKMAAD